jgi:hypothetical protein
VYTTISYTYCISQKKRHNLTIDQYNDSLNKQEAGFHLTLGIKALGPGVSRVDIYMELVYISTPFISLALQGKSLFWELRGLSPNLHINVSVSDLYIYSQDRSIYFLQKNRQIDRGNT